MTGGIGGRAVQQPPEEVGGEFCGAGEHSRWPSTGRERQKVAGFDWEAIKNVLGDDDLFAEMKKGDVTSFDIQFEIHAKTIQVITPAILQQKNLSQLSATNHDESWGDSDHVHQESYEETSSFISKKVLLGYKPHPDYETTYSMSPTSGTSL